MRSPARRRALHWLSAPLFGAGSRAVRANEPAPVGEALPFAEAIRRLDGPGAVAVVAAGDHRFANPLTRRELSGTLRFEPGARLLATEPASGGLRFERCRELAIEGLRLGWPAAASSRSHFGAGLMFVLSEDVEVRDCAIDGAPGAGLHLDTCARVRVTDVTVTRTGADGVHVANCSDVQGLRLVTRDTGDDGLGCVDYGSAPPGSGLAFEDVDVRGSRARGIAIVGPSRVSVRRFVVEHTASSGVLIATDTHYRTRRPSIVAVREGRIDSAGRLSPPAGNRFGVEAIEADAVELADLVVRSAHGCAVSAVAIRGGLRMTRIRILRAPAGAPAAECRLSDRVEVDDLEIDGAASPALLVERCAGLSLARLRGRLHGGATDAARLAAIGRVDVDPIRVLADPTAVVQIGPHVAGALRTAPGPSAPRIVGGGPRLKVTELSGGDDA